MSYVLDNPDIGSTRVLDDPTALASSGLQGVTGTVTVTGFAGAMALRGATGILTVTGRYAGFQPAPGGLLDVTPDPSGHPLSVEIVSGPAHGTLQVHADGHFTFAPDSGWLGTDSFDYRVWTGGSPGASATVVLTLAASMQGVTGTVTVTGQAGSLTLQQDFVGQGVTGQVGVTGFAGAFVYPSFRVRGRLRYQRTDTPSIQTASRPRVQRA